MLTLPRGRKVGPAVFDRRNQELTDGLISYYSPVLTGPTGLQLLDLSGQDNHGTLTNMDAPTDWVDSRHGKVLDFDGTNDYVPIGDKQAFRLGAQAIESWFKVGSQANPKVIYSSYSQNTAIAGISLGLNVATGATNQITCVVGRNTGVSLSDWGHWAATASVADNNWHHVVCVIASDGSVRFFIDGLEVTSTRIFGSTVIPGYATSNFVNMGAEQTAAGAIGKYWPGQLAELAIWNRVLTPGEIQTLYALEPGGLGRRLRDDFFLYETAIGYLLEASTASYALTGQPVPLLYGRLLPADTGSVLLSGQTTSLLTSRLLNADQGSYAYSGTDAATLLGRLLDAGAAAYTLDGNAAGFLASRRISADTVAYLASGLDAEFLRTRVLEASTGQYVLVASPVNITPGTGGAAPYYYLFLLGGSR